MTLLETLTPFRGIDLMDRRTRRFFEDAGVVPALAPAADVYEADGELVVELEVPGFDEKELKIELVDHTLAIAGERSETAENQEKTLHVHERLEATFIRRFELPPEIDTEHISATYRKGLLTVHAPKTVEATPHKIEIAKA